MSETRKLFESFKQYLNEADNNTKYIVCSYYDYKLHSFEDELKTDDWSEATLFAHDKLMNGFMVEIENTKTGKNKIINPDKYYEEFDGEFIVGPEELEESSLNESIKLENVKSNLTESIQLPEGYETFTDFEIGNNYNSSQNACKLNAMKAYLNDNNEEIYVGSVKVNGKEITHFFNVKNGKVVDHSGTANTEGNQMSDYKGVNVSGVLKAKGYTPYVQRLRYGAFKNENGNTIEVTTYGNKPAFLFNGKQISYEELKNLNESEQLSDLEESPKVIVYQINNEDCKYRFMNYDFAQSHGGVDLNDYEKVAELYIDPDMIDDSINDILEAAFTFGNTNPNYYKQNPKARSISVSDIIEYDGKKYYVDSAGFSEIN